MSTPAERASPAASAGEPAILWADSRNERPK